MTLSILLAVFLVFLNAFFVASEFAIVKVRATRLESMARRGIRSAKLARKIVANLDAYLSATQVGVTLASLGLGWVGEPAFATILAPLFERVGIVSPAFVHGVSGASAFLIITMAHVVLGELVPKRLALRHALPTALRVSIPLRLFHALFFPAIWLFNAMANGTLRVVGIHPGKDTEAAHSAEELRLILAQSQEKGHLSAEARGLLERVFEFGSRVVRQIMIPRVDMVCLFLDRPIETNLETIRATGHTRYPVCERDVDHVKGILNMKDLLTRRLEKKEDLQALVRPVHFVPDTQPVTRLLRGLQRRRRHMAIVVDEYGGTVGLVTLEDVLEEIVGEIQDEHDEEAPDVSQETTAGFTVRGGMLIEKLAALLGVEPPREAVEISDTIGGYVAARLGRQPRAGDRVPFERHAIEVTRMKGPRVMELRIRRSGEPKATDEGAPSLRTGPPIEGPRR